MDLDEAAAELYGVDLDDFMAARTRLVAQSRTAKDRPLATAVAALKKPTRSAWLLNLLSRRSPDDLNQLEELAGRLATAHHAGDLAALRALGAERTKLVGQLTATAVAVGAERGYQATEAVKGEVNSTLSAAVADPDTRTELLAGRLAKAHVYSGFGLPAIGAFTPGEAPSEPMAAAEPAEPATALHTPEDAERQAAVAARQRAEQLVREASDELRRARAGSDEATRLESEARERLDRASQEVADLRAELRAAEDAEVVARRTATEAADGVHEARGAVQQAERALADATRQLAVDDR
ncbi:hypothetical protein [Micropruina sp.]|uniref:hypothetical protein n=1 Tax=Micropruina sp. TaxID=2737536 RepID=UPI0039E55D2D